TQGSPPVRFRFPRLHYALLRLLRMENRLSAETIKEVVPASEAGLALEAIEFLTDSQIPFLGGIIRQVNKKASGKVARWSARMRLAEEDGRAIDAYVSARELRNVLPALFARDLDDAIEEAADPCVALLFDSYDTLLGGSIDSPDEE